jgi:ATP-dependent RNA helicase SUPV3L1/SUV3
LELWLARTVAHDLRPLVALETAWREGRLPQDARGLAFRLIENAGALDRASVDIEHVSSDGRAALQRYGVRLGRHTIFLPALIKPRPAQTLALLWHSAHPGKSHAVFTARPGALSAPMDRVRSWEECAAAGYRACGRIAVRFDLVEKLADAVESEPQPNDATLARLIGRPARDLPGVMATLRYDRLPATGDASARWRHITPKRIERQAAPDNAFSALATLLPKEGAPSRRRRRKRA